MFDQFRGHFIKEPGYLGRSSGFHPVIFSKRSPGDVQLPFGARDTHITETPFFLQILIGIQRMRVGEETVFQPGQENRIELQSFGTVQRHETNTGIGIQVVQFG